MQEDEHEENEEEGSERGMQGGCRCTQMQMQMQNADMQTQPDGTKKTKNTEIKKNFHCLVLVGCWVLGVGCSLS